MTSQPELDLEPPRCAPPRRRAGFAGLTVLQLGSGTVLAAGLVWGIWVTRTLLAAEPDRLASARLSEIVGEFVQAEARSAAPPAQIESEMRRFMTSLDRELQRRSREGQVVLVGEAVLTRNVPDITTELKRAAYASQTPRMRRELPARQQGTAIAQELAVPVASPAAPSPFGQTPKESDIADDPPVD